MAKESYNAGDKVVPRDFKLQLYGIWKVEKMLQSYIVSSCMANGRTHKRFFLPFDIEREIQKGEQMLFPFMYYES